MSQELISKIRKEFPYLNSDRVFFDHAAVSPMSTRVKNCIEEFIDEVHSEKLHNYAEAHARREVVRSQVSKLIDAPSDRIAFIKSTTDGMVLLARGFNWSKGDRVLLYKNEFPSNIYPWWELKQYGVEIDLAEADQGVITPEILEKQIKPGTRIISVSWVQYLNGTRSDLKILADWCHERNIYLSVDGMQGLGALKLSVKETGIDFLATGTAKWLMGPHGIGFIYISEDLQEKIHPPHLGWLSRKTPMDFHNYDQPLNSSARRFEFATENYLGIYGLNGALDMLLEATPEFIENRIKELSDHLYDNLISLGMSIDSNRSGNKWSGIITATTGDPQKNSILWKSLREMKLIALSVEKCSEYHLIFIILKKI